MPDPLAFILTWTTYGTWLPGDDRGWVMIGRGIQQPNWRLQFQAELEMTEDACILDDEQRCLVETIIRDHCQIRGWKLHALNCRTNHVHVVVSASIDPRVIRDQFKAWCTRKLKELEQLRHPVSEIRTKWWTEKGSTRYIGDEHSLEAAIPYVRDGQ